MKRVAIAAASAVAIAAFAVWRIEAVSTRVLETRVALPQKALDVSPAQSDAKEGERLAHLNGCFGCHGSDLTGRVMYSDIFGSRLAAPNLTRIVRHRSGEQLAGAIRYGVKPDGTSLIGMPSGKLIRSSDSDIAAIIAYLRTLPTRPDATKDTAWRFGGRAMLAIGLFPPETALVNKAARGPRMTPTAPLALGRYIAQSQCSLCHGRDLSGNPDEHSPDLREVIGHYSPAAFRRLLTTGEGLKGHDTNMMAKIVRSRLRYLAPAETGALYTYLTGTSPAEQRKSEK